MAYWSRLALESVALEPYSHSPCLRSSTVLRPSPCLRSSRLRSSQSPSLAPLPLLSPSSPSSPSPSPSSPSSPSPSPIPPPSPTPPSPTYPSPSPSLSPSPSPASFPGSKTGDSVRMLFSSL
ncbi:unnamed protein product [Closterium sp. Yama58-4]|nr:unnamed protein product [Closterium sp. Yama58-4]